ncbi:hypothetical protein, partial [Pigmentiphaga daeguensis]|uniref:hypothetical protein n=1 Tax=Pigmentiphaga daeguensis TaxID=414049 RepID=UPI0031D65F6E
RIWHWAGSHQSSGWPWPHQFLLLRPSKNGGITAAAAALLLALAALTVAAALAAWLLLSPATSGKGVRADACTTHGA